MSLPPSHRSQLSVELNQLEADYRRGMIHMLARQVVCILGALVIGTLCYLHAHTHSPGMDTRIALAMGGLPGAVAGAVLALVVSYVWPGRWGFRAQSDRITRMNGLRQQLHPSR